MSSKKWMIYGAYGYTGLLVCQEALRRGHKPILAGRSESRLVALTKHLGLQYVTLNLQDEKKLVEQLKDIDLVFHAAGPFIRTSRSMIRACLQAKTHYVDITGEVPVFERTFSYDERAKEQGVALISGVGFDVVPSDCLAKYVADQIENPHYLELGVASTGQASQGTLKTILEHVPYGILIRKEGEYQRIPEGKWRRKIRFNDRERMATPLSWGDLATAYRSTQIPNIVTYMAFPEEVVQFLRLCGPLNRQILSVPFLRKCSQKLVERYFPNPDEKQREKARSFVWACARNIKGEKREAWLEACEGYLFTARSGVKVVEKIFEKQPSGALTPAMAFGADFVLDIEGTKRFDQLPPLLKQ